MPTVELDETEYASLQQLKGTIGKMMLNPQARRKLQEAQKAVNPDTVIPEIDSVAPLSAEIAALNKKFDEDRAARAKEKEDTIAEQRRSAFAQQWAEGQGRVRRSGYTKEGLEALEKFMEDKGIADHEIAVAAFEKIHPPEEPVSSGAARFDVFSAVADTNEQMKKLVDSHGQDRMATSNLVKQALAEVRTAR